MTGPAIGDKVTIQPAFGTDDRVLVTVTGKGEHKGRPVFDYIDGSGQIRWAYHNQIRADVMFRDLQGRWHTLGGSGA